MLHRNRIWSVARADSAVWLAEQLTNQTFCGCCGFELEGYLFVNDSTCPDGAQEYGVLKRDSGHYVQIESLTFSWMNRAQAADIIRRVLAGEFDNERYGVVDSARIESAEQHGRCHLCA